MAHSYVLLNRLGIHHTTMQAGLKPVSRIQRYEALLHRLATLEQALHHFAMGKYRRAAELLVQVSNYRVCLHLCSCMEAWSLCSDGKWCVCRV